MVTSKLTRPPPPCSKSCQNKGGGFLLKVTKYPKKLGAFGADFSLFIQEIRIQTLVFELFGAAGENFMHFYMILERFCSQKWWFPKGKLKSIRNFSLNPNLRIGHNKGGGGFLRGGFLIKVTTDPKLLPLRNGNSPKVLGFGVFRHCPKIWSNLNS